MRKILIISQKNSEKYINFINSLNSNLGEIYEITGITYDDIFILISNENIKITLKNEDIDNYDFVYLRAWQNHSEIAQTISKYLEYKKIKYADKLLATPTYGGKLLQTIVLAINSFTVPKSVYVQKSNLSNNIVKIEEELNYPIVIKSTTSDQGKNVFLANDRSQLLSLLEILTKSRNFYIMQEFIPNDFDYRLLLIGEEISSVFTRSRSKKDEFRNNTYLGGIERIMSKESLDQNFLKRLKEIHSIMKIDIAGIDFIEKDSKYYILEVNHTPGITYNSSEEDGFIQGVRNIV